MKQLSQLFSTLVICICIVPASEAQYCHSLVADSIDFKAITKFVEVHSGWYPGWIEHHGGTIAYPEPLEPLSKWAHPFMKEHLPSAMHEDSYASDVSNMQGPVPENAQVQYFQSRGKGQAFSGMCPSFAFVDENTMVTLSFGRAITTLLLIDIRDSLKILDAIPIPGRGNKAMELAGKKARMALFRDTSGGAYFFLSKNNEVINPGPDYQILYIPIVNQAFDRDGMVSFEILEEIKKGDMMYDGLSEKEGGNKLTAVMPDAQGNVWYTSKMGVIGVIDLKDFKKGDYREKGNCPKTYSHFISEFGLLKKIEHFFGKKYDRIEEVEFYREGMSDSEFKKEFREYFMVDSDTREEIQNSFSIGPDGVYVVSSIALHKLRFNNESKKIEMDPSWELTFSEKGDQIYPNDCLQKKGQLNDGSGTTPTLMDNRFVVIADNDYHQINVNIYSQKDGSLVSRHKVFKKDSSACENSIVAYHNSLFIGNTYNYTDPFNDNETPGGINRFDYNEKTEKFELREDWPADFIDAKTATPKMSTITGLIYVYNREEETDDRYPNWQIMSIDFETGKKVFYIRPDFDTGGFNDNISFLMKSFALGLKHYEEKVFNNIWATYTFGPNNSIYIGAYRGFLKFFRSPRS
jgi:hypothetical protein